LFIVFVFTSRDFLAFFEIANHAITFFSTGENWQRRKQANSKTSKQQREIPFIHG
jgi:hypothetical protein